MSRLWRVHTYVVPIEAGLARYMRRSGLGAWTKEGRRRSSWTQRAAEKSSYAPSVNWERRWCESDGSNMPLISPPTLAQGKACLFSYPVLPWRLQVFCWLQGVWMGCLEMIRRRIKEGCSHNISAEAAELPPLTLFLSEAKASCLVVRTALQQLLAPERS